MDGPPVQDAPPTGVIKVVNPVLVKLLRSPLHRAASGKLMLLTVTGRKTGRHYTVPVGRYEQPDGTFVVSAGGTWRYNLRGGADVRVTLDGREHGAHAVLEEDQDRAAEILKGLLDRAGARALALKINVDHQPTAAEIRPVLSDRGIAYLSLTE